MSAELERLRALDHGGGGGGNDSGGSEAKLPPHIPHSSRQIQLQRKRLRPRYAVADVTGCEEGFDVIVSVAGAAAAGGNGSEPNTISESLSISRRQRS